MATVLFAWELGSNLGHLTMLLPIAKELRRLGHRVVFALCDLSALSYCASDFDFEVVQAPRWLPRPLGIGDALAFSDILPEAGYFSMEGLSVLVTSWQHLFRLTEADLVVCEHAPTALLAARISKKRAICIGTGFVCPPQSPMLPRFTTLNQHQQMQLQTRERGMLRVCNAVLAAHGCKPFRALAELYHDAPALLCTYPELDHYGNRPGSPIYLGPIYGDVAVSSAIWPETEERNVLVYLNNFVYLERQIAALRSVRANILIVALNLSSKHQEVSLLPHMTLVSEPIALETAIRQADMVICHGGHGTVAAALTASKPVLIWPTQQEQGLMALNIARQRLGAFNDISRSSEKIISAQIDRLLQQTEIQRAVNAFAAKYGDNAVAATVSNTAGFIARMLGQ